MQLRPFGLVSSMSRRGNCYDNAPNEEFLETLRTELIQHRWYATRTQARQEISEYIEFFYNRQRRHSQLANLSPVAFAQQWARQQSAAGGCNHGVHYCRPRSDQARILRFGIELNSGSSVSKLRGYQARSVRYTSVH